MIDAWPIQGQLQAFHWSYAERGLLFIIGFLITELCKMRAVGTHCEGCIVEEGSQSRKSETNNEKDYLWVAFKSLA